MEVKKEIKEDLRQRNQSNGFFGNTLRELDQIDIQFGDLIGFSEGKITTPWDKIIKLTNFNASKAYKTEKQVLSWEHTFEEALGVIRVFFLPNVRKD